MPKREKIVTPATADALVLRIESGADSVVASSWDASLLVCAGDDPLALAEHATARAASLSSGGATPPRLAKPLPRSIEDFGWCTWDACYSRVSASILEEGVGALRAGGVPPRTLVIDDGWQCTDVDPVFRKKRPAAGGGGGGGGGGRPPPPTTKKKEDEKREEKEKEPLPVPLPSNLVEAVEAAVESVERAAESVEAAVESAVAGLEADARAAAAVARAALDDAAAAAEYEFEAAERRALAAAAREAAPGSSLGAALAGLAPPPDAEGGTVSEVDESDAEGGRGGEGTDDDDWDAVVARSGASYEAGSDGSDGGSSSDGARTKGSPTSTRTLDAFPPLPEQHAPRGRPKPPTDLSALDSTALVAPPTPSAEQEDDEESLAKLRKRYLTDSDSDESRRLAVKVSSSPSSPPKLLRSLPPRGASRRPPRLPGVAGAAGGRAADLRSGPAAVGLAAIGAVFYVATALQRAVGASLGGAEAAGAKLYAAVVEPAPADSWQVRLFAAAARGPLRPVLLEFYAAASDFTRRLTDVRANSKFSRPGATPEDYWSGEPERLGDVVRDLKQRMGVRHVVVWHALSCYWGGVAPAGEVGGGEKSDDDSSSSSPSSSSDRVLHPGVAKYDARVVYARPTPGVAEIEPSMLWNPAVLAGVGVVGDPEALYRDLHSYLAESGVDGVKVDGQAGAGLIGSALDGGPSTARRHHEALERSVAEHLPGNNLTNCMCHSTENLFRATSSVLCRASDDFYPRDRASSAAHVGACAYNAVFLSGVSLPDWDMFHSRHGAARLHAAARAVSGGPVYVSDAPGAHDFALLRRLVLRDGRVLRALLPARPTADRLFRDPQRDGESLLKVWNANRHTAVVAALHVQGSAWCRERRRFVRHDDAPPPLGCRVSPSDAVGKKWAPPAVDGENKLRYDGRWVATFNGVDAPPSSHHHHHSRHSRSSSLSARNRSPAMACGVTLLDSACDAVDVELEGGGTSIVTMAPVAVAVVKSGSDEESEVAFAPLGLRSMFNGGGAVASFELGPSSSSPSSDAVARVGVVGAAPFSSYCSVCPTQVKGSVVDRDGEPSGEDEEELEWRWDERCGELVVVPPSGASEEEASGDWAFSVEF